MKELTVIRKLPFDQVTLFMKFLVKEREARKLLQEDVALLIGVSQSLVNKWERGVSTPKPKDLQKYMELLGYELYISIEKKEHVL